MKTTLLLVFALMLMTITPCFAAAPDVKQPEKLYAVYDGNWGLAYYMKGNALYDTNWELQYYIKGKTLFDKNWRRYGVIKGNDIYDDHNYLRYRIKEYNPPAVKQPSKP
jgi:hypothetical protein